MPATEVTIINKLGLHARAAAKLVALASNYNCSVRLGRSPNKLVDGKNIMSVMMLAASQGTTLHLETEGDKDAKALQELVDLINDYFGEGG